MKYDVAIVGGGLAGLSSAVLLARRGWQVVVLEKGRYPFHRVCGEYISRESVPFLESLGIDSQAFAQIDRLVMTAPSGRELNAFLGLGGIGVSRYLLDDCLQKLAREAGAHILEGAPVETVSFEDGFWVKYRGGSLEARQVLGCYGKRSKLDIDLQRPFVTEKSNALNNFIGVKYHIRGDFPHDTIFLHNFPGGYCGMSKIEADSFCLCYMTTAQNLRAYGNSFEAMQQGLLYRNPRLKEVFSRAEFVREQPVTISQISFSRKSSVVNHILMAGDASGMIAPLCGNGMSMALHAGKLSASLIHRFLDEQLSREQMEVEYLRRWHELFAGRLFRGRLIQRFMGGGAVTELFVRAFRNSPGLTRKVIASTHGKVF